MQEIAIIITASAALVTAVGVVVGAASKLAPVLTAINKMLADQYKRAKEAKKEAQAKRTPAVAPSAPDAPDPFSALEESIDKFPLPTGIYLVGHFFWIG